MLVMFSYWAGLKIDDAKEWNTKKRLLALFLIILFCPLVFYKYLNFFINNINFVVPKLHLKTFSHSLPLGISFISFTLAAYLIDVFRGKFRVEKNFGTLLASVVFFPHLIAGPIVRPSQLIPQLKRWNPALSAKVRFGGLLFSVGLFKKLVFADSLAPLVNQAYSQLGASSSVCPCLMAFYGFTLQIYCDFSGYTDMALGLSWILGIRLPGNFKRPYVSKSLIEFWRRWHITLSFWLRDYLYIPLGGNRTGFLGQMRNVIITMLLGGFWHGANWTFVAWGALHGVGIVVNYSFLKLCPRIKLPSILSWFLTLHFVAFGWVFFRAPEFGQALHVIRGIFSKSWNLSLFPKEYFFASTLLILFTFTHKFDRHAFCRLWSMRLPKPAVYLGILIMILTSFILSSGSSAEFIYFDF
jgi:alginate O-acetyltransferase complex protein AlgI